MKETAKINLCYPLTVISTTTLALLIGVATCAGFIDAIAGGGGMLTVPSILHAGVPTHLALGSNKGCSIFGTASATLTFFRAGKLKGTWSLVTFFSGAFGAVLGANLQLFVAPQILRPVVVCLLILAAVVLFLQRRIKPVETPIQWNHRMIPIAALLGAYDGFFGPGTGTFLIVAFSSWAQLPISSATAYAKTVNLGSNAASLAVFAIKGTVIWKLALPMAIGNILGGTIGAQFAIKKGDEWIRRLVLLLCFALVVKLLFDMVIP